MPVVRDASAPSTKATAVVTARANSTATHGFQPSLRPFDQASWATTALPTMKPATPASRYWASDTMPP